MVPTKDFACFKCIHHTQYEGKGWCEAFPSQISDDVLMVIAETNYDEKITGQTGDFVFEEDRYINKGEETNNKPYTPTKEEINEKVEDLSLDELGDY